MKPINRLLVVEIVTTALVVTSASTGAQTEKSESSNNADARRLNTLLNPDGTLNLTTGFSGNVDSSGWALASGPGGEPRFTRTDSHQSEDDRGGSR